MKYKRTLAAAAVCLTACLGQYAGTRTDSAAGLLPEKPLVNAQVFVLAEPGTRMFETAVPDPEGLYQAFCRTQIRRDWFRASENDHFGYARYEMRFHFGEAGTCCVTYYPHDGKLWVREADGASVSATASENPLFQPFLPPFAEGR